MSGWITETLLASTVLMLVVLAVRQPVALLFGPRIAYALWLLPALRMVMPPLPEVAIRAAPVTLPMQQVFRPDIPLPLPPAAATAPVDWTGPLATIWLAGAVLAFLLAMAGYVRFARRMRADARQLTEIDGVPVWATGAVEGPLAYGILRRAIALPADYADQFAPEELALALRHERMHHQRCDLIVNMAALVLRSIHWFNPVAHFAWRAFRADQEMACDAAVIAASGDRHTYALALWKSAWGRSEGNLPNAACAMNGKGQLKRRLGMINRKVNSRTRTLAGGAAIVTLMGVGLGLTASGGLAAEQVQKKSHRIVSGLVLPGHVVAKPPVPPVPATVKPHAVPDVPDAPSVVGRIDPPAPPEAPEPPEVPDMAAIKAEVEAATAEASRAADEANRAVAEANRAMKACGRERGNSCGDVDMVEIRREVLNSLREAQREVDDDDVPVNVKIRVKASLNAAITRIESDPRWN